MSQIAVRATTNQISIQKNNNTVNVSTNNPVVNSNVVKNEVTASIGTPKNLIISTPVSTSIAVLGNLDGGSFFDNYNFTQSVNGGAF